MEFFLVFASLVLAISASTHEELWVQFKQDHGKTYKSLREEKLRYEIFKSNIKTIKEHNDKYENGEVTWFMGTNQFTDMTDEEFKTHYLTYEQPEIEFTSQYSSPLNFTAPDSIDWREKGAVLPVKDQGQQCAAGWAFSALGAVEGQNAIKHNITEALSEQELIDCSIDYGNLGCNGGRVYIAFEYLKLFGVAKLADYGYKAVDEKCRFHYNSAGIKLTGYNYVARNQEDALKEAVASVGPISVTIDAGRMRDYAGGIFNDFFCGNSLNHNVLAVGYGSEDNQDFWIVKNSWGSSWGEKGYIRMTRNRFNQCCIASQASYPIIA